MSNAAIDTTAMVTTDPLSSALVGLEPASASRLRVAFEAMFTRVEKYTAQAKLIRVTGPGQKQEEKLARTLRLAVKADRVEADKVRKSLKSDVLLMGRAIDGAYAIFEYQTKPIEDYLREQETYSERIEEAARVALRDARADSIKALGADPAAYADLGLLDEGTWASVRESVQAAHDAKIQAAKEAEEIRVQAEKIAAEKREQEKQARLKAEAERVERERLVAEENARLRVEAEEREAANAAERKRVEEERAAERAKAKADQDERSRVADLAMAASRAEQERLEGVAQVEREKAQAERAARDHEATASRLAAERSAKELAATKAAAEKAAREREEAESARVAKETADREVAALAPDKEKLASFARTLLALNVPTCATPKGQAAAKKITEQLEKTIAWIARTGESL